MAQAAAKPTTTPAAMPAVFGPLDFFSVVGAGAVVVSPGAVTTTVFQTVTTDGADFRVVLATGAAVVCDVAVCGVDDAALYALRVELELASGAFDTTPPMPVNATDQALSPPPNQND